MLIQFAVNKYIILYRLIREVENLNAFLRIPRIRKF